MTKRRLFLASASSRRKEILRDLSIPFQVVPNELIDEEFSEPSNSLRKNLRDLAYRKAFFSKKDYKGLILGVDTVVVLNDLVLGKPKDISAAKVMLRRLSGNTHYVYSGLCVYDSLLELNICRTEVTEVSFRELTSKDIDDYCRDYQVLDKAGSYAIQDIGKDFVTEVKGSYLNVVGLPVNSLLKILRNYDIVL
jgi:septum formation protein